ncbi:MAG: Uma2 family endonuclease, partial [Hyphomicrobiaceae bacterium]
MTETARKAMTAEEFLTWQLGQEQRYELIDGFPAEMAGASAYHDRIVINIIASLHTQLRGSRCRPTSADLAVRTRIRSIRRPDVAVTCDEPRPNDYEAGDPRLIVEVLSPSNEGIAWQRKIDEYRRMQSLTYLLLVESRAMQAT